MGSRQPRQPSGVSEKRIRAVTCPDNIAASRGDAMVTVVRCPCGDEVRYQMASEPEHKKQCRHSERDQPGLPSPTLEELTHVARSIRLRRSSKPSRKRRLTLTLSPPRRGESGQEKHQTSGSITSETAHVPCQAVAGASRGRRRAGGPAWRGDGRGTACRAAANDGREPHPSAGCRVRPGCCRRA